HVHALVDEPRDLLRIVTFNAPDLAGGEHRAQAQRVLVGLLVHDAEAARLRVVLVPTPARGVGLRQTEALARHVLFAPVQIAVALRGVDHGARSALPVLPLDLALGQPAQDADVLPAGWQVGL